jgi:hypothetical protein
MELAAAAAAGVAGGAVLLRRRYTTAAEHLGLAPAAPTEAAMTESLRQLDLSRLLRRLAHEDGLGTIERANGAIGEYKRFLRLVFLNRDEELVPSAAVDSVWQRHLLDTKVYHEDCLAVSIVTSTSDQSLRFDCIS